MGWEEVEDGKSEKELVRSSKKALERLKQKNTECRVQIWWKNKGGKDGKN